MIVFLEIISLFRILAKLARFLKSCLYCIKVLLSDGVCLKMENLVNRL